MRDDSAFHRIATRGWQRIESLVLPSSPGAVSLARSYLRERIGGLSGELAGDAEVLVSELVTNAIVYGRPSIVLKVSLSATPVATSLAVAVSDGGARTDLTLEQPDPRDTHGRGLIIVDALASRWGIAPHADSPGKTVWFEMTSAQRAS